MSNNLDLFFMEQALKEANLAAIEGEVPVGAVIVCDGKVFSRGRNRRIAKNNSIAHAEIEAISAASKKNGDWRLEGMTIYVTSEPCIMCSGAIIHSRIKRVVYGCREPKMGGVESICRCFDIKNLHHKPEYRGGVLEDKCSRILTQFFKNLKSERDKKRLPHV